MSRIGIIQETIEKLKATNVPYVFFVSMGFSQTLYLCTAPYSMRWNEIDWLGLGLLGTIDVLSEQATLEATGVNLTLSGIPSELVAIALGEQYQGKPCSIWIGILDDDLALRMNPVRVFLGRIDTMAAEVGETASITVSVESRLVAWERARVRRYNHVDQISRYPDDRGFEFVAQMVEKELQWGGA